MPDKLTLGVYRTKAEGRIQVALDQTDENGNGTGYRLAGPKHYNLGVTELLSHQLDERDAKEIRAYLDAVFPQPAADPWQRLTDALNTLAATDLDRMPLHMEVDGTVSDSDGQTRIVWNPSTERFSIAGTD